MLRHTCDTPTTCKRCQRNAQRKNRYHADPVYRNKLQTKSRLYKQTTPLSEASIRQNRAAALARYHRVKDSPAYKAAQKQYNQRRRPKLHRFPALPAKQTKPTTQRYWRMVIGLLAERDGWICYLCHLPTTWQTVSIDHVIPQCLEPENDHPTNLRLAHRRCNSLRGLSHRN